MKKVNINWTEDLPFNHKGKWQADQDSIMSPGTKITFPQFIMEMVIYNMSKYLKDFPKISKGPQWSLDIPDKVKKITQQAYNVCNYFPHPIEEPLVTVAFKNYFRNNRVFTIGQYRKTRFTKAGKCNITDAEKNIVKGVQKELDRLINQRDILKSTNDTVSVDVSKTPKFRTQLKTSKKLDIFEALKNEQ